jgi:DNA/RNA-binding domain of Phe-tRNA-synthetase-like protein
MSDMITYQEVAIAPPVRERLSGVTVISLRMSLTAKPGPPIDLWDDWRRLHAVWRGKSRKEVERDPRVQAYRGFYERMGLDPSRTPPSVQSLVQRFLRDEVLTKVPTIHPIVDAVNVAAVETMIPLGVFDAGRVEGEITIDISVGGESFRPIGSEEVVSLPPGLVVLRDDEKVLSQFCSRDSEAQKITPGTRSVWLLACQVPGVSESEVAHALVTAVNLLSRDFTMQPW